MPNAGSSATTSSATAASTAAKAPRPVFRRPTSEVIRVAAQVLRGRRTGTAARAMVLATDGAPTCTSQPLADTLAGLRRAAADGIPTYVIGIADDVTLRQSLQQLAVAGTRPRPGSQGFYSAQSAAELQLAFSTIRDQVGACSFLTSSVPDAQGSIIVSLDGARVPFDETGQQGWRWTDRDNGELTLVGDVCTAPSRGLPASSSASPAARRDLPSRPQRASSPR